MVNWIIIRDAHPQNFTYRRRIGLSRVIMKYSKSNLCRSKGHQCYFLFYFCHFVFGWSAKVFGKIRKSSLIFGGPRVSLCVSGLTADQNFWCSRVFLAVLRVFRGIMGCSGVLWDVPGVFRGCSGLFRAVPGCSGGVPGCSGGVPGCSEVFRGVPGVFRVLQTPVKDQGTIMKWKLQKPILHEWSWLHKQYTL